VPSSSKLRDDARAIWQAAVDAVRPEALLPQVLGQSRIRESIRQARRIVVVGAGKAGAAMSAALESALPHFGGHVEGTVNVPAESVRPLKWIKLHAARPAGTNQPTAAGVEGAERILALASSAGPDDLGICLLSGGGSALLPAPVATVSLEDKQQITQLLHACGATINEMNAVRKHLSRIKGGRLAQAFTGRQLFSLIISDVIGDPLDVIASGPTAADSSTFADALAVMDKFQLRSRVPVAVMDHLQRGAAGEIPETLKTLPANVRNAIIGNNAKALAAAHTAAEELGYTVINLGSNIAGETAHVAASMADLVAKTASAAGLSPVCILSGGETTVTLGTAHGLGGRNQEFVLAAALKLGRAALKHAVVLSGGTDGEDGPTDAAGAVADDATLDKAARLGLDPREYLQRHDAYHFFEPTGDLLKTGLTQTNVMDVRVILIRDAAGST
jgi:hydroxypyruvate reductase/glycerate 2-kinase